MVQSLLETDSDQMMFKRNMFFFLSITRYEIIYSEQIKHGTIVKATTIVVCVMFYW